MITLPNIRIDLTKWYLGKGMPDRLAEAVIVCGYLEQLLEGIPASQTGRLKPVFDADIDLLKADWHSIRYRDLWFDHTTGEITDCPPPGDGEPIPMHIEHLPEPDQRRILFARFSNLFAS